MKQIAILAFLSAALAAGSGFAADGGPAFVMRIDDCHSPADWRQVCETFERHGFRCSLAVNAVRLDDAQGKCLKELAERGHEILDHTPSHNLYSMAYPDSASFERARKLPFAHDADDKTRRVFFDCVVDAAHPSNRKIRARVSDGKLVVSKGKLGKAMYTFVKFPSNDEVYGLSKDFSLRDFWGRKIDKAPRKSLTSVSRKGTSRRYAPSCLKRNDRRPTPAAQGAQRTSGRMTIRGARDCDSEAKIFFVRITTTLIPDFSWRIESVGLSAETAR